MSLYETLKHQVIQPTRYGESGKVGEPKAPVENTFERYPTIPLQGVFMVTKLIHTRPKDFLGHQKLANF
jgi:hypothetical protein